MATASSYSEPDPSSPTFLSYSEFKDLVSDPSNPYTGGFYALEIKRPGTFSISKQLVETYLGRYQPNKDKANAGSGTTTLCFEKQSVTISNDLMKPENNTKIFKTGESSVPTTATPTTATPTPVTPAPKTATGKKTILGTVFGKGRKSRRRSNKKKSTRRRKH